jgi:hypothetical protein
MLCLWPMLGPAPWGLQVSNDFELLYYNYKVYLLDVMAHEGRLPLWSPSECGGFPFYASPFTASFYPLNVPLAAAYRALGGYSWSDHQWFTVLGVSIFCVGLFAWLRAAGCRLGPALAAALVASTSLKVTELLRFPNAVHTAAWLPWLLLGARWSLGSGTALRGGVTWAIALLMLVTAGYPYFAYYAQFLVGPYVLLLALPGARKALSFGDDAWFAGRSRGAAVLGVATAVPLLLTAPYHLKVAALLAQTTDRQGGDWAYSTGHPWTLVDTLGSLVYPPAANTEGWYYLGQAALLVLALYLVRLGVDRAPERRTERGAVVVLLVWALVITWITMGRESTLFTALWRVWPGFSSLRTWPRLNIILVPLLALLAAHAFTWTAALASRPGRAGPLLRSLAAVYGAVLVAQLALWGSGYVDEYWTRYQRREFALRVLMDLTGEVWFLAFGAVSAAALGATIAWLPAIARRPRRLLCVGAALLALNALEVCVVGVLQWSSRKTAAHDVRRVVDVPASMRAALRTPRRAAGGTISLDARHNVYGVENWYFERYAAFLATQGVDPLLGRPDELAARAPELAQLLGVRDGRRLYAVERLEHPSVASFLGDAARVDSSVQVRVTRYTGDELVLDVRAAAPVYVCFIDCWDPDWRADVDGRDREVLQVFGTFKAVRVTPADREVVLRYAPFRSG